MDQEQLKARLSQPDVQKEIGKIFPRKGNGEDHQTKLKPNMGWATAMTLTKEEAKMIDDPEWVYENLIIKAHVLAIVAPPGAGKTTICMWIAGEIASEYDVYYVNADTGQADAKAMIFEAERKRYTLMLPDLKPGMSMTTVINRLYELNESNVDCSNIVFFFDTLKKMTAVINKNQAANLYKLMRALSGKGMTIVLLGHTNKYKDAEGKLIYEGTGDLRSDLDDLIYLSHQKGEDGTLTVSTDIRSETAKTRGKFEEITFEISPLREVRRTDYIDVGMQNEIAARKEADFPVIEIINEAIDNNHIHQVAIIDYAKEHHKLGRKTIQGVLKRWSQPGLGRVWIATKGFQNNRIDYQKCAP